MGVSQKFPRDGNQVAWNQACGGRVETTRWSNWPLSVVKIAIKGDELSGLDFGAADLIVGRNDKIYMLELNTAPSVSDYRARCFAKAFDYAIQNGKTRLPLVNRLGGYLKFGHPSVVEGAWL